ncbi:hypothetical protein ERO13_A05G330150v2 [Gossypium hirsutum]|nr:hypothetical protein ERO13_A05G330150v2 [Gossypium hirsutum]
MCYSVPLSRCMSENTSSIILMHHLQSPPSGNPNQDPFELLGSMQEPHSKSRSVRVNRTFNE